MEGNQETPKKKSKSAKSTQVVQTSVSNQKVEKNKHDPKKPIQVLFYNTTLEQDSLLIESYDFIQYKLCDVFDKWYEIDKNTYILHKKATEEQLEDKYGLEKIQKDKYHFQGPVRSGWLVDYLQKSDVKFNMLILADAANLIDIFYDCKAIRSLFDEDIKELYQKIKDFYAGLHSKGVVVNIYYNEVDDTTCFAKFEMFYSYSCIWCLDIYLFLLKVMNELFVMLEPGVYEKKGIEDVDGVIEKCYNKTLEELFVLCEDKLDKPKELVESIDKIYFNGNLQKNTSYNFERPIVSNASALIQQMLNMEEEKESPQ